MNYKMLYFDIETNPIEDFVTLTDLKTVHCISIFDQPSGKLVTFSGDAVPRGLAMLDDAAMIVGHNIIGFDLAALQKVYGWIPLARPVDTLVLARCLYPDIRGLDMRRRKFDKELWGSHSLKAWGQRIDFTKAIYGENEDAFEEYCDEMKLYCERDVLVCASLGERLRDMKPDLRMIYVEHAFALIIRQQEFRGFAFDVESAGELAEHLTVRRAELLDELQQMFPAREEEMKTAAGWSVDIEDNNGNCVDRAEAATKAELKEELKRRGLKQVLADNAVRLGNKMRRIPFNPGSRQQIKERLEEMGWESKVFEPNGKVQIDEAVLRQIDHPAVDRLLEYLMVTKRLGQLAEGKTGWLSRVKKGRIHGKVNTNGAVTGRCTHSLPNLAQVPAVRASYGRRCRSLFRAGDGYSLVGVDASGLELRCLAHYLAPHDGGQYARFILEDDVHSVNQRLAGLPTRDQAKTFIYAFLYGAGDAKLGDIIGGTSREGHALKKQFLQKLPALRRLKKQVEDKAKRTGALTGLDGRPLPVRSEHAALNMLLQSAGAVVMKQALTRLDAHLQEEGWLYGKDYAFVVNVHDEFQTEVPPEKADEFGVLAVEAIRMAGEFLEMNCPLDGEYKVGTTWAETH